MTDSPLYRLPQSQPGSAAGIYFGSILAVVGCMVLVIWATTQWTAWRLDFQAGLGEPWLAVGGSWRPWLLPAVAGEAALGVAALQVRALRGLAALAFLLALLALTLWLGPVYPPWAFFVWDWRYGVSPDAEAIFSAGHWMIAIPGHLLFVVAMVLAWRRARTLGGRTDSFGSARWATEREVRATGLLDRGGVFVGGWRPTTRARTVYLRHDGPQNVLGFAPSRSGKGVGWVIPTLLTWPHSAVIHDIKGENWALTAGWRREGLGNLCLRFDPTCGDGSGARYNPLAEVRLGPREVRDAQNIADILVDPDGDGAKDHWDLTAQELLVATILHVLYVGREKTLRSCLELLTSPARPIEDVLEEMREAEHDPTGQRGWVDRRTGASTRTHPVIAGSARSLANKSDNERSSVVSSAVKFLSLHHDDVIAANTATSDFSILDLMHHERPVSLYLCVPPSDISRTRPLLRLLIHQLGRRLTERMEFHDGRTVAHYRHRLLLMLDEFSALGRLDFLQTQLAYLPGYGIKAFLILQDLAQLYAAYGRDESILSNCHVRIAYAPNKVETARLLSDMAGTMTVHKGRRMYSGNRLAPWLPHVMASEEETQRPLLTPDEAMRLPEDSTLIFSAGHRPIHGLKVRYYEDPVLSERARMAPPPRSDRLARVRQPESTPNPEPLDEILPDSPAPLPAESAG